jgi:hypothetical protein
MPYIGNTPADKFLTLAKQSFSTSATTSYTLDSAVSSTQDIALFINNVRQSPVDAYSVSGTALTLTSATAGTDEMYCVYLGKTVGTVSPASDSVTTAMIQANAVTTVKVTDGNITGAKLNTDVISGQTALAVAPADTDEFMVSDGGVLKRIDYSLIKGELNTPSFKALRSVSQAISNETSTVVAFNSEIYDTDSAYATGSGIFTVPTGKGGKYWFGVTGGYSTSADISDINFWLSKNNQGAISVTNGESIGIDAHHNGTEVTNQAQQVSGCFNLADGDTMRVYTWHNYGSNRDVAIGGRMTFSGFRISS